MAVCFQICVVSTLSGIVTTTGAAAFSHYEGSERPEQGCQIFLGT
jgi:hypothetical protein